MNVSSKIYIGIIALAGGLALLGAAPPTIPTVEQLTILCVLITLATIAQFFEVRITDQRTYYPHNVFFFAGVLLLPPILLVPLYTIPLVIDAWRTAVRIKQQQLPWDDLSFNIAAHVLTGAAASWIYFTLNDTLINLFQIGQVFAAIVAATTFVLGNHTLFRLADIVINNATWRQSAVWMTENLWTELIMAYLGYVVAVLWFVNPVMILPMLGLMFLLQQALMIPRLQLEAQTDSKTGLLNVRYFNQYFDEWLARAKRTQRPLSIMMADLDFLRRINNNYGHLAGDIVLVGISEIIERTVRSQDIVGRFGGEEFAILLPDTDQEEAFQVAEAVRLAIAESSFEIPTNPTPIRTTMTFGIACYPQDATTATDLLHHADVAVYQGKMDGRNRVICANDLFYRVKKGDDIESHDDGRGDHPQKPKLLNLPIQKPSAGSTADEEPIVISRWYHQLSNTLLKSAMAIFALIIVLLSFGLQTSIDWPTVTLFSALAAVAQFLRLRLFSSGGLSITVALIFAAALLTGIPGLALVSLATVLPTIFGTGNLSWQALGERKLDLAHDWAIGLLAGLLPALLMPLFNVPLEIGYLPLLSIPLLLMVLAYSYSGVGLIAFNVSVSTLTSFQQIWKDEFYHAPGQHILMSIIGLCFAVVYTMFGATGFLLCVLPIFVMRFAQETGLATFAPFEGLATLLRQHLSSSDVRNLGATQTLALADVPFMTEADQDRIEQYLQFRDELR